MGFPFTRGIWMLLQILGAISPKDLDLIDETLPFSRFSLETISGRKWSMDQYNCHSAPEFWISSFPPLLTKIEAFTRKRESITGCE